MLKLRYSTTSPFVRKVSVTIIECGLENQVENQLTNPFDPQTDLPSQNPLGKVPALIIDDHNVLFDSPVICEYLDSLSNVPRLFPVDGKDRWNALRLQALGDGIMDAGVGRILESRRPSQLQSQAVSDRHRAAIERALDALQSDAKTLGSGFTIGHITVAVALEYLDFRFASENWRADRSDLTAWHESVLDRPSLQQTQPHD